MDRHKWDAHEARWDICYGEKAGATCRAAGAQISTTVFPKQGWEIPRLALALAPSGWWFICTTRFCWVHFALCSEFIGMRVR